MITLALEEHRTAAGPRFFQTAVDWREQHMITLALAGKPNCGKSTFFKAATCEGERV